MSSTSVSVVMARRPGIEPALAQVERYLESTGLTFEVLAPEAEDYGVALRRGVSEARGRVIVVADAAMPYPVTAIGDAVALVDSGATDVVFAASQANYRGGALLRWLLVPQLPDRTMRLAALTNAAAKTVAGESRLRDGSCELEFAYLANKYGFRVEHLVVVRTGEPQVSFGTLRALVAALRIRLANRRHAYRAARRCPVCFSNEVWTTAQIPGNVVRACRRCKCRYLNQFADEEGTHPVRRVLRAHGTPSSPTY